MRRANLIAFVGFFVLLLSFSAFANTKMINGIKFPDSLAGFELRKTIDSESLSPGLGVTLYYNIPGVKASVYVYDKSFPQIKSGIDSPVVAGSLLMRVKT